MRRDYERAIPLFLKVLERRPRYWLPNFNLGYVYYRVGNLPLAEQYLQKAIDIYPRDAAEFRFLGFTLLESGQTVQAESALRSAISLRNEAPNQHYALGTILKQRGDLEGARQEFSLELKINPDHAQARQELSTTAAQPVQNHR